MREQLAMMGSDWLSDRDVKKQAKAEKRRKETALDAAKKLEAASLALAEFVRACNEVGDDSGDAKRGVSDGRHMLKRDMDEYWQYLERQYGANVFLGRG